MWAFSVGLPERVSQAFPSAAADVTEGGRCAGFGFHSASVFHMVRAARCGLRALAAAARTKRTSNETPEWASTIALVEERLSEAERSPAAGERAVAAEFFSAALNEARMLHDAERKIASGGTFDEHHALAVLHATRSFLTRLAEHAGEQQGRALGKSDVKKLATPQP
jgi:hypothetical protein